MYHAKGEGRGRAVFYQASMQQALIDRMKLENDLQHACLEWGFRACIISRSFPKGRRVSWRWRPWFAGQLPDGVAWTPPSVFIPIAEENGLIVKLGEWILRSACRQFASWRDSGFRLDYISVNVSVRQLKEPGFVAGMLEVLRENGMRPAGAPAGNHRECACGQCGVFRYPVRRSPPTACALRWTISAPAIRR